MFPQINQIAYLSYAFPNSAGVSHVLGHKNFILEHWVVVGTQLFIAKAHVKRVHPPSMVIRLANFNASPNKENYCEAELWLYLGIE